MRRALAFVIVAGTAGVTTFACDSFSEGTDPSSTDAATGEAASAQPDAGAEADALPGFCKLPPVAEVDASFDQNRTIPFSSDDIGVPGCSLGWTGTDGANDAGALVATCTSDDHAQVQRVFPLGTATRARLTVATKVTDLGDTSTGETFIGCTLSLDSMLDGGDTYVALNFEVQNGQIKFDQDTSTGGSTMSSIAVKAFEPAKWIRTRFDVLDITSTTMTYKAFLDDVEVVVPNATVPLQGAPHQLRVKCGIDHTIATAVVLVDDLDFQMCEAP
jgi:hypothetical protein